MKASHRFFRNRDCQYFPCHKTDNPEEFNCLFCFCPLYFLEDCGGQGRLTPEGVKDCTPCTLPHRPEGYDHVIARLKKEFARRKAGKKERGNAIRAAMCLSPDTDEGIK